MKTLNIFKPGKHTSSSGVTLDFNEDAVRAMVAAYDPAVHEAPIVVGHPQDNAPAYGWVKSLAYSEESGVEAEPHQIDDAFSEMVAAGKFKKISASLYTPDSPSNPKPGTYYLRHVGFLGAQPPAVKGLRDASFTAAEEGVLEFATWETGVTAGIFRRLREFLLEKFGADTADKVVPSYAVEDLEDAARRPAEPDAPTPAQAFTEPQQGEQAMTLTPEQLADLQAKADKAAALEAENATLKQQASDFAEREKTIRNQETAAFIDSMIAEGKVLPAQRDGLVAFMAAQNADGELSFGEGDKAAKAKMGEWFRDYLKAQPKMVDFGEHADANKGDATNHDNDPIKIARAAEDYVEAERKKGRTIGIVEAVEHVTNQAGK